MTASSPAGLSPLLDQLDEALAAATPGPWDNLAPYVVGPRGDDGLPVVLSARKADAAAIVSLHNAVPTLIAELRKRDGAIRAVETLVVEWEMSSPTGLSALAGAARHLRAALTAALTPGADTAGATA